MRNARGLIGNIYSMLINDEKLLRLLHYPPFPPHDPLSSELADITSKDEIEYWDIVDRHILLSSKSEDLVENSLCRLYVYLGKPRPHPRSRLMAKQEIVIDVFCHNSFERDQRLEWINERLSELLFNERIKLGMGKTDYRAGYNFTAPKWYTAFRHIYEVGVSL